jgi:hypothetical protein
VLGGRRLTAREITPAATGNNGRWAYSAAMLAVALDGGLGIDVIVGGAGPQHRCRQRQRSGFYLSLDSGSGGIGLMATPPA